MCLEGPSRMVVLITAWSVTAYDVIPSVVQSLALCSSGRPFLQPILRS